MDFQAGLGDPAAFDRERAGIFLEKADIALPDDVLAALRTRTDDDLGIDAVFLKRVAGAFGFGNEVRLARASFQGTFHRLYEVSSPGHVPRLLRLSALEGAHSSRIMSLECRVAGTLRQEGFPIPCCEYREVSARGAQLVDLVPHESLASVDDDEPRMVSGLAAAGQFLARLHRVTGTGYGPLSAAESASFAGVHAHWDDYLFVRLNEHLGLCEAQGAIASSESVEIAGRFAAARSGLRMQSRALLHGDPGSHNFMVDDTGIRAVIDWEDALLGDPLFDLASLCTFQPERRHAAVWSAYGAAMKPGDRSWTRFWLYFLRISLAKTVHRSRFAYADRPGRPPASRRIQLALARLAQGE